MGVQKSSGLLAPHKLSMSPRSCRSPKSSRIEVSHPGDDEWEPHQGRCWITSILVVTFSEIGQRRALGNEVSGSLE